MARPDHGSVTKAKSFWQFALVNTRLAEVFFHNGWIVGHCYVKAEEYQTQKGKRWMTQDTRGAQFTYRGKAYRDRLTGKKVPSRKQIL